MKIVTLLLCCIGLCCCNNSVTFNADDYPKHIQLARFMQADGTLSKLSSVAKKNEYVVLETNNDCLIGATKNIQATDDGYLIRFKNAIYYFGKDGEFRSKIDHIGKGPGEYLSILPHYIHNPDEKEIIIPDNRQSLLVFDYNGQYKRSIEFKGQTGMDFSALLPDGNIFIGPMLFGFPMYSTIGQNGQVIKQFFAGPRSQNWFEGDQGGRYFPRLWISNHPEGVLAADDDDTTWLVRDAENATPYLVVDAFVNKNEDNIYVSPINYLNQNYLGFDGREYGIYSLLDDQYYVVNGNEKRKLDDDIDNGLPLQLYHAVEGKVYSLMDAIDLLNPDNPDFNPDKRLSDLIKGLKENDNPVLRIVTLRDKFIID